MLRRIALVVSCLAALPFCSSTAAAADEAVFQATVQVIDGAYASSKCGISDDGQWVVGNAATQSAGVVLHNLSTGEHTTVSTTDRADFIRLSDDGRFVSYTSTRDSRGAQVYQYDRDTGETVELATSPLYISNMWVSSDGDLVFWTEQTYESRPGGLVRLGDEHTWIWRRATNQRVEVTRNPDGANPSTPFDSNVGPWIVDADGIHKMWYPSSGNEVAITAPDGVSTSDIEAVSNDGERILYTRFTGNGQPFYIDLIVAGQDGTVLATQTKRVASEFNSVEYWITDDGKKVFVRGYDSTALANDPLHIVDVQPYNLIWDVDSNTMTRIVATGLDLGRPCAGSHNLRWLVGTIGHSTTNQLIRIDTQTEAPTPVDPAVLEGPQLSDQIQRLYRAYFKREADAAGLSFWLNARAGGTPLINASNSFADSPEFRAAYGDLGTGEFVTLVYNNVLGRSPDQTGLDHWVNAIDKGMTRGELMLAFSESPEFIDQTNTSNPVAEPRLPQIHRMYRAFLLRDADAEGLSFWNHALAHGKSLDDIAAGFVNSPEFVSQYGALTDEAYIELVYDNVLDRSPDAAGRAFWLARLQMGMSRGAMMTAFSESREFIIATNTLPPSG